MNLQKTKILSMLFLTLLMLSAIPFVNIPLVKAADIKTYAFVAVSPNRISLGEQVVVNIWLQPIPLANSMFFMVFR